MPVDDNPEGVTHVKVRKHNGYWTIFVNDEPILSCVSLVSALDLVDGVGIELSLS